MNRFVCIHGHFYQPPRENPWLEVVETQESAAPFHDWNQRVCAECYAPNAAARILDESGQVRTVIDNYRRISFNFGPTLLAWMEQGDAPTYRAIREADRASARTFSGHGSALAQVYNHAILPLCNPRDQQTQVLWGRRDFEHRFGRPPEGMWLAETAVDNDSLEALAAAGIRFTVLAPGQAAAVRPAGETTWQPVADGAVESRRPYRVPLPSGRSIAVFYYDGARSSAIAFGGLLGNGDQLAERLLQGFDDEPEGPQLVHVATDGESYGHHYRHGEMALARALERLADDDAVRLTNYGEFLARFPPTWESRVVERSAWSCPHALGRWSADCGCATGEHRDGQQRWRAPLREALDWLRDALSVPFERSGAELFRDPWAARDDYIDVLLERSAERFEAFLARHARGTLTDDDRLTALRLLELQRQTMLMYTSCAWFFDELSRIETVQVLRYAARALELGETLFGCWLEEDFLGILERAESNVAEYGNGRRLWELKVRPARPDPQRLDWIGRLARGAE